MNNAITYSEVPEDVLVAWAIESTKMPVGARTIQFVIETMVKYPEWFGVTNLDKAVENYLKNKTI